MSEFVYSAVGFVVALGILVTVHEFGHYWVARRLGVKVLRFSIGFGRPLWSRRAGSDQTEYVIAMIPLGGYVKMLEEHDDEDREIPAEELPRAFNRQRLWKRTAIVLAGPLFNFLFALVAYWGVYLNGVEGVRPVVGRVLENSIAERGGFRAGDEILSVDGRPTRSWDEQRLYLFNQAFSGRKIPVEVRTADGALASREIDLGGLAMAEVDAGLVEKGIGLIGYLPEVEPIIGGVMEDSPADAAGFQRGDEILSIDGQRISLWQDVVKSVRPHGGESISVQVKRGAQILSLDVIPERVTVAGQEFGRLGIEPLPVELPEDMRVTVRYGPIESLTRSVESVWAMSALTIKMLVKIFQLEVSAKNISGPLTIAQYAGHTVQVGLDRFVLFLAVVSISLGVLNLLPIPILDGGHLLYYAVEAVTGGPVPKQVLLWGQQIGIVLLFALMSLAFYNDIVRLFQ